MSSGQEYRPSTVIAATWTQLPGAPWCPSVEDGKAYAGVAAASCLSPPPQSRGVMRLCPPEEMGL